MNKILTILLLSVLTNLYAGDVLDSEQTDYEFEDCTTMSTAVCSKPTLPGVKMNFYPVTTFGFYSTGPGWYIVPGGIKFNPVPISNIVTHGSYVPSLSQ